LAKKEATLEQKLASEIKTRQKELEKSQSKVDCIWNFIMCQQVVRCPWYPNNSSTFEEQLDENDEHGTTNLGNDSYL